MLSLKLYYHFSFVSVWPTGLLFTIAHISIPSQQILLTEASLANCHFSKKDILQSIRNPDSNKAHGFDMISIHTLKFCGFSTPIGNF